MFVNLFTCPVSVINLCFIILYGVGTSSFNVMTVTNMKTMLSSIARTKVSVINEDFGDKRPTKAMVITRANKTVVKTRKVGKSVKATIIGDLIKHSYMMMN